MSINQVYVRDHLFQDKANSLAPGKELDLQGLQAQVNIDVEFGTGTFAGVITVEESSYAGYTGTWAPLRVISWGVADSKQNVKLSGTFNVLRCRISTAVTGGTVTVTGGAN